VAERPEQPGTTAQSDGASSGGPRARDAATALGLQGTLFDDLPADERPGASPTGVGYRGPTACSAAGITYRQLDYWARTGLVEPSVREASGSGTQRLYSFRDILVLKVVKKLLDAGISLPNIRTAIGTLHDRGVADLAQITLMSDGTTVYECTSTDEVVDLLQGGQAVFAIAVGRHVRDVEGTLAQLPGERARAGAQDQAVSPADELATRRRRRSAG
jgi:DNA-binding transcriptional MerR regulator